jgi:hypothetical protein
MQYVIFARTFGPQLYVVQDAGAQRVVSRLALLVRTLLHNVPNQDAATNQAVRLKK